MSKRAKKKDLERENERLRELVRVGIRMSNFCYNVKQLESVPRDVRESARQCQVAWDKVWERRP